jgi:nitroreductase
MGVASASVSSACSAEPACDAHEAFAERTWEPGTVTNLSGRALGRKLIRCATLAPFNHNTQCWKFALRLNGQSISILSDLARG